MNVDVKGDRIVIGVEDRCGGLPPGHASTMFMPFHPQGSDRTGLGLGLSIVKESVESHGESLTVKSRAGWGCVFCIDLPNSTVERRV